MDKKFRAWDKKNKRMNNGGFWVGAQSGRVALVVCNSNSQPVIELQNKENFVVEEWTGLLDKSGKDLDWWEGDLLTGVLDSPVSIVFENGAFYFQSSKTSHRILCSDYTELDGIKVIGTIHGNKRG